MDRRWFTGERFLQEEEDALVARRQMDENAAVGGDPHGHFVSTKRGGDAGPIDRADGEHTSRPVLAELAEDQGRLGGVESHLAPRMWEMRRRQNDARLEGSSSGGSPGIGV